MLIARESIVNSRPWWLSQWGLCWGRSQWRGWLDSGGGVWLPWGTACSCRRTSQLRRGPSPLSRNRQPHSCSPPQRHHRLKHNKLLENTSFFSFFSFCFSRKIMLADISLGKIPFKEYFSFQSSNLNFHANSDPLHFLALMQV